MSAQVTDRVPPEVWLVVFQHARLPISPALSRPKRSELRQQTLTVLARTCKLFNALVNPLLYKTVITDDISEFINVKRSPHRRDLLSLCESLYIEYQDPDKTFPYESLLDLGGDFSWRHVGPNEEQAEEQEMRRCTEEMGNIEVGLLWLCDEGRLDAVLPRLTTMAIGALYGHQGDLWARWDRHDLWVQEVYNDDMGEDTPVESRIKESVRLWDALIERSHVSHICIRDPSGPLGLSMQGEKLCPTTIHFGPDTPGLELNVGQNATWVSDVAQDLAWEPMYTPVAKAITVLACTRALRLDTAPVVNGAGTPTAQVDIYGSTSDVGPSTPRSIVLPLRSFTVGIPGGNAAILSVDVQRAIARAIGDSFSIGMPSDANLTDTVRWFASHDYPGCKSCGSGPPL